MTLKSKGSILIATLWVIVFFSIVTIALAERARSQMSVVIRMRNESALTLVAQSGIGYVQGFLHKINANEAAPAGEAVKDSDGNPVDLFNVCLDQPAFFKNIPIEDAKHLNLSIQHGDQFGLMDEQALVNLNYASQEVFRRMYVYAELSEDNAKMLAQKTVEYRNRTVSFLEFGFKKEETAGYFGSVEELLLVDGMTDAIFQKLKNHLTVYGPGKVNFNSVSEETLRVLGLDESLARKITQARERIQTDLRQKPRAGQRAFETLGDVSQKVGFLPDDDTAVQNIGPIWGFDSKTFRFWSNLRDAQGRNLAGIECVMSSTGEILSYKST